MPTRNVVLTKRQEKLIETLVESGRYQNASEVLRDGLRLVEHRETEDATKLKVLRAAARVGVAALDRGEFKEFENIEDLQAYLNDLSEKVIAKRPNRSAWSSANGAFASAPRQSSISRISSNGPLRISTRASPNSTGTRSFRRSANLPTAPTLLGPRPETRSCGASARSTLRDTVVADVTSFCTG